ALAKAGKFLMCRILAGCENAAVLEQDSGWYDRLVYAISVDDVGDLKQNDLSIVTFNYDRSIDYKLHKFVESHFNLNASKAWNVLLDAIPIIHLHGILGDYPETCYDNHSNIYERSQSIEIVSEVDAKNKNFTQAIKLLNEAERVVVFGFGFGEDNVRRLKFFREKGDYNCDIFIAAGPGGGAAKEKQREDDMAKWGLLRKEHYWSIECERFFGDVGNPFD
ncbi:MAG: hypothetical protein IH991_24105, partial [Planctomycetes bacterium]|nr:hypothetical protein [Planctomycetota bacterium]